MKPAASASPRLPRRLSLAAQTAESLCESIRVGEWREHLPGERELSERLQVSRDTLRVALEELQRKGWIEVSDRQRRRIKHGRIAPKAGAVTHVIRVLSPRSLLTLPLPMAFLVDAMRERLAKLGARVELHDSPACFSAKPDRALEELVRQNPAAVWVALGSRQPMQRWFIKRKLPCLVVGSCAGSVELPSIDADHRATCHHACGVLLRKGHRRIALVLPRKGYDGDADSELGFREAFADRPECQSMVLRHDGSAAHLCALLDSSLRSAHPPTAYIVARSQHVLTAMMHLMRRGRRIPQDVAVISRDDDPYLQSTSPLVTRYTINPAQMARRISIAVSQLVETGFLPPRGIRLIPEFVPGETV